MLTVHRTGAVELPRNPSVLKSYSWHDLTPDEQDLLDDIVALLNRADVAIEERTILIGVGDFKGSHLLAQREDFKVLIARHVLADGIDIQDRVRVIQALIRGLGPNSATRIEAAWVQVVRELLRESKR